MTSTPAAKASSTTLVTGPVRSGKSRHAEHLMAHEPAVTYVATGRRADLADPEWTRRVEGHRVRRPMSWRTVETSDVVGVIGSAGGPVLVDCLGTWLTALVDDTGWHDLDAAADRVAKEGRALVEVLRTPRVPVVVVTNEVGWSLVPTTASGRFFQDELGRLNAAVAAVVSHVHLVVAGRVLDLSDAPVVPEALPPVVRDA
ncbi:adenosylcobinamide kinase /adenosylcobinamide-phosphate guanylyltransferase [Humibacillus xanthopallidus]|uniref:Adenosylcobinamide kinase n=1 Tax=Humibacillus xanthopallidus TaxID=412689 RepID=A0A543PTZ5_9MICO|nr:bifunctional adenosylcobinamide kinase/adenosylcobinamide-phosphate guanylyltransferase [Humibacillus xanthopallidus]TQN47530.1 adenosylcobinamide kinase /adenosylcobinamide-phosphate guanylyltransferase [Humibacillus xanthopallidus]